MLTALFFQMQAEAHEQEVLPQAKKTLNPKPFFP
jgi:hypothetical protein